MLVVKSDDRSSIAVTYPEEGNQLLRFPLTFTFTPRHAHAPQINKNSKDIVHASTCQNTASVGTLISHETGFEVRSLLRLT